MLAHVSEIVFISSSFSVVAVEVSLLLLLSRLSSSPGTASGSSSSNLSIFQIHFLVVLLFTQFGEGGEFFHLLINQSF